MEAIRRRAEAAIQQFNDWSQEKLEPDEGFQNTATAERMARILTLEKDVYSDGMLETIFIGTIHKDGAERKHGVIEAKLPAWSLMSTDDIRRQVACQVVYFKEDQDNRQKLDTTERYLGALRKATFHLLERRACQLARSAFLDVAKKLRAVANDSEALEQYRQKFLATKGPECFSETFGMSAQEAEENFGMFGFAVLQQAEKMEYAAGNIGSDHFLHNVDVFKSMPEITRALTASLPPGSFLRDSFLSGLRTHSEKRRFEQNTLTALKLACSLAAQAGSSGFGALGQLLFTGATTTIGTFDTINNYRHTSEVMRQGVLSGGMNPSDWRWERQQRSQDLLRDVVSLAGNVIGALRGTAAAAGSAGVQIGAAAEGIASSYIRP